MALRRVLRSIALDKIAAVDDPCQEHARAVILKRKFTAEERQTMADKGHAMPDGSFPIATVADLENAISALGRASDPAKAKKHIITRARALDAIDKLPADWNISKAIAKATFEEALQAGMTADAVNQAFYQSFDGLWERNDAFRTALTDELEAGGDGETASAAYVASVKALVDEAVSQARDAGASASDTGAVDKALSAAVLKWLEPKKEPSVMKITDRAGLLAAVSAFSIAKSSAQDIVDIKDAAKALNLEDLLPEDGPIAKAKPDPEMAKMRRELSVLKLSPDSRAHFDGLDTAGQDAFLAKSEADQAADIEKAKGSDPVVHKCKDGTEIRKSDGPAVLALAKRNDELTAEVSVLKGSTASVTIEKRAVEEFPNVAKGTAVAMLKSIEALGADSEEGKDVLKSLTGMQNSGARLFKVLGTDDGEGQGVGDIAKARGSFEGEVAKIAARDKLGTADAMSKARVEHPELFAQAFPQTVEAIEDRETDAAMAS